MLVDSLGTNSTLCIPAKSADNAAQQGRQLPTRPLLAIVGDVFVEGRPIADAASRKGLPVGSVLCVDDDPESIEELSDGLRSRSLAAEFVQDFKAALAKIFADPPDLIVSSMRMQGMSGLELLQKLHQAGPEFANIPFIFLTCQRDRDSELAGRRLGAHDYFNKPLDLEMLAVLIENRLQRAKSRKASPTQVYLSAREKEVLTWVGRGKTSGEIAIILGLSERTVNFHCDRAMKRLNVVNRTQAVATAIWQGSISL